MATKPETQILTFVALAAMDAADLFKLAADTVVKPAEALTKAKDKVIGNLKDAAKVVAAMKRLYTDRLNKREIDPGCPFKKFFKDNARGELSGRVEAMAVLFNSLVLTLDARGNPMITEEIFDGAAPDWLEKASAIVNAAQKAYGENWKTCDEVLDVINALSKPGDAAKKLKEIRKRQKGEGAETGEGENTDETTAAQPLTVGRAVEFLIAAIRAAKADEQGEALFHDCHRVNCSWDNHPAVSEDQLNSWSENINQGVAPGIKLITAESAMQEAVAA